MGYVSVSAYPIEQDRSQDHSYQEAADGERGPYPRASRQYRLRGDRQGTLHQAGAAFLAVPIGCRVRRSARRTRDRVVGDLRQVGGATEFEFLETFGTEPLAASRTEFLALRLCFAVCAFNDGQPVYLSFAGDILPRQERFRRALGP